jgi:hypothetical protein
MPQNSELDARTGAPSDFGPTIEKSPDALYGDSNTSERPSNRRDGIARTRAIVSNPVFGPISTVAVGGVGVLIDVTDPVMFLCLGAGLTGWSDLTVEAD